MGTNGVRLFLPPFQDPVNPNLEPALVAAINEAGTEMAAAIYDAGLTGVAHQQTYDLWWHGGVPSTPTPPHNIRILSEGASTRPRSPTTPRPHSLPPPAPG